MEYKTLRTKEVIDYTGLSQSTIYAYIDEGKFPKPIKITSRLNGWIASEVQEWLQNRISQTRGAI